MGMLRAFILGSAALVGVNASGQQPISEWTLQELLEGTWGPECSPSAPISSKWRAGLDEYYKNNKSVTPGETTTVEADGLSGLQVQPTDDDATLGHVVEKMSVEEAYQEAPKSANVRDYNKAYTFEAVVMKTAPVVEPVCTLTCAENITVK